MHSSFGSFGSIVVGLCPGMDVLELLHLKHFLLFAHDFVVVELLPEVVSHGRCFCVASCERETKRLSRLTQDIVFLTQLTISFLAVVVGDNITHGS